jgi:putative DNA primase/helicase
MGLLVQEATLNSFFERSGGLARGTGFFARFLVALPESTQGTRFFSEAPSAWPNLTLFNRRVQDLLSIPAPFAEGGGLDPTLLSLSPEAKTLWTTFHDTIEKELGGGGELYDVRDVASKAADNVARLAALFHILEHGPSGMIEAHNLEGASRIVAWHLNEARRFFGELALPAEIADSVRLDVWLASYCRKNRVSSVSRRDVQRNITPVRLREASRLNQALRELDDADRVREVTNGKQKTIYVNPALLEWGCA